MKYLIVLFLLMGASAQAQVIFGGGSAGVPITNTVDPFLVSTSVTTSYTVLTTGNSRLTLTNSSTLAFSGAPASNSVRNFTLTVVQGGSGSNVITWPGTVKWSGAASPTLSTSTTAIDVLSFMTNDQGTTWLGFLNGVDMR